jgi:monofunctional glycosyltransferase
MLGRMIRRWQALPPRRRRWLGIGGGVLLALYVVGFVLIPYPLLLPWRNPDRTAVMEQRIREARAADRPFELKHEWVELEEISPNLQRAVTIAEDDAFRDHRGIAWKALAEELKWSGGDTFSWRSEEDRAALIEALRYGWENRDKIRGRSTITQQVAKNLYFGTERSASRKVMEFVVARRLERRLSKDRILEIYLNIAEWGPGIFGAEAAAQHYYNRSAAELTRSQAAALAATLPHPLTSNPARNPGRMARRQSLIMGRLGAPAGSAPAPIPPPDLDLLVPEVGAMPEVGPGAPQLPELPAPPEGAVGEPSAGEPGGGEPEPAGAGEPGGASEPVADTVAVGA